MIQIFDKYFCVVKANHLLYSELPVTRTPDNSNFYYLELFSSVPAGSNYREFTVYNAHLN